MPGRLLLLLLLIAVAGVMVAAGVRAERRSTSHAPPRDHRLPSAPKCPILPTSNPWNQRVDTLSVAPDSSTLIASIGLDAAVHPDFGAGTYEGGPIGIPYTVVRRTQRRVPVSFAYADESDRGRYPIPPNAAIQGGPNSAGDRHVLIVDRDRCRLYELFGAQRVNGGTSWRAGSGAIFDLRSNRLRPKGFTSADAAGLPILPGLVGYHDVQRGSINHALRFTAPRTRRAFIYPARHFASDSDDPSLPPMGLRVRLKATADLSGLAEQAHVVARALQRYGALLADNGGPWNFSGVPDQRWSDADLRTLGTLKGSDFEVVDTSTLPRR
jgi:hypothetical protein